MKLYALGLFWIGACSFAPQRIADTDSAVTDANVTLRDSSVEEDGATTRALIERLPRQDSLMAFWPMEGDWLNHTLRDGFDGNPMGDVSFTDEDKLKGSQAAVFDGDGDFIQFADVLDMVNSSMTISQWFRSKTIPSNYHPLVDKLRGDGNYRTRMLSNGKFEFEIRDSSRDTEGIRTDAIYNFGQAPWVHFVVTFDDATTARVYLDGRFDSTLTNFNLKREDNTDGLTIGFSENNSAFFDGWIDDVAIWNQELNASEVLEIYQAQQEFFEGHSTD